MNLKYFYILVGIYGFNENIKLQIIGLLYYGYVYVYVYVNLYCLVCV